MPVILFKSIGGYCDYLDAEQVIKVRVQKKQFVGQSYPVHIPTVFECPYANKCQRGSECPIWKQACKMIR